MRRVKVKCNCPTHCKYCGARRKKDYIGHFCGTNNCQWEHGFKGCFAGNPAHGDSSQRSTATPDLPLKTPPRGFEENER